MKKKGIAISLSLIFLLIICISADFKTSSIPYSIDKIYGLGENITGWINLSLTDEPTSSFFQDSLEHSIGLIDFLNKNEDYDYTCSTLGCVSDYSAANPSTAKNFDLGSKQSAIIGIQFTGIIDSINSVDFIVESDASSSCYNQLTIDFLNDGAIDIGNDKSLSSTCSFLKSYGCFNDTTSSYNPIITTIPYCQRVQVFESPGFRLGAWIIEEISGTQNLTIALYDTDGDLKKSCILPKAGAGSGTEIYCDINYLTTKSEDYYVCVYSDGGTGTYKAKGYASSSGCGFNGFPSKAETNAYKIFAEGKVFAAVGTLNISNSFSEVETLNQLVSDYVFSTYGSLDCTDNCIVPIKITSGKDQQMIIKDLQIIYNKPGLVGIIENKFYDLTEIPSKVSAGFQKLSLDKAEFALPKSYGKINYQLNFRNKKIFSEELSVENVPSISSITPTITSSAYPTLFKVNSSSNDSKKYEWDFGDNTTQVTTINEVMHTYSLIGVYSLSVTATDSLNRSSSGTFQINVSSPKEIINSTLAKKFSDLDRISLQVQEFDLFYQEQINSALDIESIDGILKQIQLDYKEAFFEEEYNQILTDLLNLEVPEVIFTSKSANSILSFPKEESIDLSVLEAVEEDTFEIDNSEKYIDAILFWNQEHMETKITFKEISARYDSSNKKLLSIVELNIDEKKETDSNPYLFIQTLEDMNFKENYLENEESGYTYIELTEPTKIVFSTTEEINLNEFSFFISPKLSQLNLSEVPSFEEESNFSKWILFISLIFLLLIIGIIVYITLQIWYKKKYEDHLFKNRTHLYNLVTYIENSRKKGLKDSEISSKLKKAGWDSEQVAYAMKKHSGKRTGMLELPIEKFVGLFRKKSTPKENPFLDGGKKFY